MKTFTTVLAVIVAVIYFSCGEMKPTDSSGPSRTPDNVQVIFTAHCAKSGCHAGSSPEHNQNLDSLHSYSNIVNVSSLQEPSLKRVKPGDPANSYLLQKVKGTITNGTGRMPFDGAIAGYLTTAEIDTIQSWVQNGAPAK